MSPRYLLVVGGDIGEDREFLQLLCRRTALGIAFSNGRMAALAGPSCRCIAVGEAGCVLGSLFPRHGRARPVEILSPSETAKIAASGGLALPSSFWGGYVAAVVHAGTLTVSRDPSASLACYQSRCGELVAFASDADILVRSGFSSVSLDVAEIGRQLYRAFVPARSTALYDIRELPAGFALDSADGFERPEPIWSPWNHVEDRGEDPAEAAEGLARTVRHCVQAWASDAQPVLLSVSGGLDSSIIAACLAKAGTDTACLTMFTEDPSGDERPFARALCAHLKLPLIERAYRLEDIDITEPLAANLPRPKDRTQANAYERVHRAVADDIGAAAFMTGNGGDHVFGYSQSAAPIADRYLSSGIGPRLIASLGDVCRQTGCSITDALGQAWRLARRPPGYCVRPNPLFLSESFVGGLGPADVHHPWLDAPAGALPGKAAHIATILRALPNLEPSGGTCLPLLNPLVSQPIVEACLRIPSWEWRSGGRDRSLARRAFAGDLPSFILERRVKGTPGRFAAQLLERFRNPIRERLLGGHLASRAIIDVDALYRVLAGERPVADLQRVRILELVNAEGWIDHWIARGPETSQLGPDIRSGVRGRPPASGGPIR
jgi:asparagine synthase (glutamine-hydrolysing)